MLTVTRIEELTGKKRKEEERGGQKPEEYRLQWLSRGEGPSIVHGSKAPRREEPDGGQGDRVARS